MSPPCDCAQTPPAMQSADVTRLAIVTGGSRGLGEALCDEFEARGYTVYELSRSGEGQRHVAADLSDPQAAADAVEGLLGRFDKAALTDVVIVSNAAVVEPIGAVGTGPVGELIRSLQVNFVSAIAILATALMLLDEVVGRKLMVHLGSGAAHTVHAGLAAYSAGKGGMEQFMRVVALEQSAHPRPFLTAVVDPGAMDTEMQAAMRQAGWPSGEALAEWQRRHAAGELADAREVAARTVRLLLDPGPGLPSSAPAPESVPPSPAWHRIPSSAA
jgi:benzil reductase ((S)-benzoin forming)